MKQLSSQVNKLILHEIRIEWKSRQAFTSIIVYSLASIYITYLCFRQGIDPITWNALFWIILLFAATNAVAKSFLQESRGLQFYYYTLLNPRAVILSKTIYNVLLLVILGMINFACYAILFEIPIGDLYQFLIGLVLGSMGLSATLTLVSGIVSRANNNASLVAILGFPLLFPLLLTTIRFSKNAIDGLDWSINQPYFIILSALNVLIIALSYLLFPYLWRE
ncbi:heme exporter protein CcmB [soil metagenome]